MSSARAALLLFAALLSSTARAQEDPPSLSILRPGGGFLATSVAGSVPLVLFYPGARGAAGIAEARVMAAKGRISGTRVVDPGVVLFHYQPPERRGAVDELLDVELVLTDGDTRVEAFTLPVPEARRPDLELELEPPVLDAGLPEVPRPRVRARAKGVAPGGLVVLADRAGLRLGAPRAEGDVTTIEGTLTPPELPPDAPGHLGLAAVASGPHGFSAKASGVAIQAPIRVSVQIPPGSELVVEGAESTHVPVRAPADGKTVLEDVVVRHGARFQVFERRGGKKRELSVVVPAGVGAPGIVAAIPGQAVADGGTGPTLVVAVPPSPFGGKLFWPEVTVEGAQVQGTIPLGERAQALVLVRPTEPRTLRVRLDDQLVGEVELVGAHGHALMLEPVAAAADERAAARLEVRDLSGNPTDTPAPEVRAESGEELRLVRERRGVYRVTVPPGAGGPRGSGFGIRASIPRAPAVAGPVPAPAAVLARVTLSGKAGPMIGDVETSTSTPRATAGRGLRIGVGARALAGSTLDGLTAFGAGATVDVRLGLAGGRFLLRAGLEVTRGARAGEVQLGGATPTDASFTLGVLALPLELGVTVLGRPDAGPRLLARLGGAVRLERGALEVGGDRSGGAGRTGVGLRGGLELALPLGRGELTLAAVADALGSGAPGLSSATTTLEGSLLTVRGELGFALWR